MQTLHAILCSVNAILDCCGQLPDGGCCRRGTTRFDGPPVQTDFLGTFNDTFEHFPIRFLRKESFGLSVVDAATRLSNPQRSS